MQFPARALTDQYISLSYQDVLQQYYPPGDLFYVLDGLGNVVATLNSSSVGGLLITSNMTASITVESASYALSASHADTADASDFSYTAASSSVADISIFSDTTSLALYSNFAGTASYVPNLYPQITQDSCSWASQSLSSSYPWDISGSYVCNADSSSLVIIGLRDTTGINSARKVLIQGSGDTGIALKTATGSREAFLDIWAGNSQIGTFEAFGEQWGVPNRRNALAFTAQKDYSGSIIFTTKTNMWYDRMTIANDGNVGIGVSSSIAAKLQVDGNISASSITSSLFGTSSWSEFAVSASYVPDLYPQVTQDSCSWASSSISSSYSPVEPIYSASISTVKQDTLVTGNTYSITSSWANNAISAINATTATNAINATNATNAVNATTAETSSYPWRTTGGGSNIIQQNRAANVGVGLTVPSYKLHVSGSVYTSDSTLYDEFIYSSGAPLHAVSTYDGVNSIIANFENITTNGNGRMIVYNPLVNTIGIQSLKTIPATSATPLILQPEGGNVGIGAVGTSVSIPGATLHVRGNISASAVTASLKGTASYSNQGLSSSYALTAKSASYAPVEPAYSASISTIKQDTLVTGNTYPITSSWSNNAVSASWASASISASYAPVEPAYSSSVSTVKQNTLVTGNTYAITSSWSNNAVSASWAPDATVTVVSSSWASSSISASYPWFVTGSNIAYVGGNVGVGTAGPGGKLHVSGGDILLDNNQPINIKDSSGVIQDILTLTSGDNVQLFGKSGTSDIYVGAPTHLAVKSSGWVGIGDATPQSKLSVAGGVNIGANFDTAAPTNGMIIEGNVGIGTLNPSKALEVGTGSAQTTIRVTGGGVNKAAVYSCFNRGYREAIFAQTTTNLYIGNTVGVLHTDAALASGSNITITTTGNVGIGITSPINKLDVNGNISCSVMTASLFTGTSSNAITALTSSYLTSSTGIVTVDVNRIQFVGNRTTIGYNAGLNTNAALRAVQIGYQAGYSSTTADYAIQIGGSAGFGSKLANEAVQVGYAAGIACVTASLATQMGFYAGYSSTNATYAVQIGNRAGYSSTNAPYATQIGYQTGYNSTNASYAIQIGGSAGYSSTTANNAIQIGYQTGYNSTTASYAVQIGSNAGQYTTDATSVIQIGQSAGQNCPSAKGAIQMGYIAGRDCASATYAIQMGYYAGYTATTSDYAIQMGYYAGTNATTASNAIQLGNAAGRFATNSDLAVMIGGVAGYSATTANNSVMVGYRAGAEATNAAYLVAIGNQTARYATQAGSSVILGYNAAYNATTASNAVIIGTSAASAATNCADGVFVGYNAGGNAANGRYATMLGNAADANSAGDNVQKSIAIGYNAKVSQPNTCVIGGTGADAVKVAIGATSAVNTLDVNGNISCSVITASLFNGTAVGIGTGAPSYQLHVTTDSTGKPGVGGLWTVISDERIKKNITLADLDRCYEIVKEVPLKYFAWQDGVYTEKQVKDRHNLGWIAQDVQKVFPKSVATSSFTKTNETVIEDCLDLNGGQMYMAMYGALQKAIQKIESLETEIKTLKKS